jgi:hypothetical protein
MIRINEVQGREQLQTALYMARKIFNLGSDLNRVSFDGVNLYDFYRKTFASAFRKTENEYEIYDFGYGNYLSVKKFGQDKVRVANDRYYWEGTLSA